MIKAKAYYSKITVPHIIWKDLTLTTWGHKPVSVSSAKPVQTSSDTSKSCSFTTASYDSLILILFHAARY